jgi:hypothetical protein
VKTWARSNCGQWGSDSDAGDGRCGTPMGPGLAGGLGPLRTGVGSAWYRTVGRTAKVDRPS